MCPLKSCHVVGSPAFQVAASALKIAKDDGADAGNVTPDIFAIDAIGVPLILTIDVVSIPFIFITYNSIQVLSGLKRKIYLPLAWVNVSQNVYPTILTTLPAAVGASVSINPPVAADIYIGDPNLDSFTYAVSIETNPLINIEVGSFSLAGYKQIPNILVETEVSVAFAKYQPPPDLVTNCPKAIASNATSLYNTSPEWYLSFQSCKFPNTDVTPSLIEPVSGIGLNPPTIVLPETLKTSDLLPLTPLPIINNDELYQKVTDAKEEPDLDFSDPFE